MNYGKRKASKKQQNITSKGNMRKKKIGVRLFKGFLLCILVFCIIGVIGGGIFVKRIIDNAPEITPESIKPQGYTSIIYADDNVTETDRLTKAGANRVYKSIDEIPLHLQHAFVAIEDSRFYTHNGIDPQGILRAFVIGITNGGFSEGASTITQQLIKNNVFPDFINEDTFLDSLERKIQEQYLAIQIERQLDKDTILESYMNTINLGQNTLGVQAASLRYFGKDVSELTLSESATIAGITQNPGKYNPVTNPEDNAKRRKKVLDDMLEQGYITQAEYDEAMADDVYARIQTVNTQIQEDNNITSYFNDALAEQLMDDLTSSKGLGYTDTQAYNIIYGGGLSIFSTQNLTIQSICDEELNNNANFPSKIEWGLSYALTVTRADGTQENYSDGHVKIFGKEKYGDDQGRLFATQEAAYQRIDEFKASIAQEGDTYDEYISLSPQPQSSVCVIEQSTGHIKALVGGRGEKTTNRGLNRAYKGSTRQAGSTFKILAVYAPAFDSAGRTLADVEVDEPYEYKNGKSVGNWWGSYYTGPATLRKAIWNSMNIPAVKVLDDISIDLGYEYVTEKFGISTLDETDKVQALALGGITHGVYNYELTAAYAAIANGGVYNEPILYTKVLDHDGNVLIDNTREPKQIIKDTTAALLTSAMEDVVSHGTASPYAQLDNMAVAGKSGTTNNNRDFWFSGYTPYYTCTIWMGYDDNKEMSDGNWYFHERIWSQIMDRINSALGLTYKDFTMPSSLVRRTICTETGLLALPDDDCKTYTEWFAPGTAPTETCEGHNVKDEDDEDGEDDGDESGTGTSTPGTTTPGTTTPGTTTPGTTTPGTSDPGTTDPGTSTPGTTTPGTTDPGTTDPGTTDPSATNPASLDE